MNCPWFNLQIDLKEKEKKALTPCTAVFFVNIFPHAWICVLNILTTLKVSQRFYPMWGIPSVFKTSREFSLYN